VGRGLALVGPFALSNLLVFVLPFFFPHRIGNILTKIPKSQGIIYKKNFSD